MIGVLIIVVVLCASLFGLYKWLFQKPADVVVTPSPAVVGNKATFTVDLPGWFVEMVHKLEVQIEWFGTDVTDPLVKQTLKASKDWSPDCIVPDLPGEARARGVNCCPVWPKKYRKKGNWVYFKVVKE